ncbi:hypothetical protein BDA96_06G015000 [Sorghum bicolor]|uniref:CBS domain-containing protein n=2 Tax=Sorghum bicolor TaxID=4558 RepID=A0A921QQH7_SORBI|nr:uncharacterized protein LOC8065993 [Sorghum bicolor]EES11784.2 hypothetical protein SORBI_3006G013800 [Sorghum bicolor]KAG0524970.1 hypothetical protein BDA96_06G015000 [Sorghum bicolor]|eukprot:XP_002447456.2 uncharacterized protein LOC8065993 [Sorghum bicolor]
MAFLTPFSAPASAAAVVLPVPPPPSAVALVARRRAPVPSAAAALLRAMPQGGKNARRGAALVVVVPSAALDDVDVPPAAIIDDADLRAYLESQIVTSDQMSPAAKLTDVMSRPVQVATPGQRLAEVDAFFAARQYSGLPVVDDDGRCIGVISNKDKAKAPNGMESTVGEVMSSPAITLTLYKTVLEAAALMLKEKVHRIPVVNEQQHVIGIVTRSDVFQTLEPNNKA